MNNVWVKMGIGIASLFVMMLAVITIVLVHAAKLFRRAALKDPFHNSRQHPLNSPVAPRG